MVLFFICSPFLRTILAFYPFLILDYVCRSAGCAVSLLQLPMLLFLPSDCSRRGSIYGFLFSILFCRTCSYRRRRATIVCDAEDGMHDRGIKNPLSFVLKCLGRTFVLWVCGNIIRGLCTNYKLTCKIQLERLTLSFSFFQNRKSNNFLLSN